MIKFKLLIVMNYKPILIMKLPFDSEEFETSDSLDKRMTNRFPDWHILVVYEDREEALFEAYGAPDLDEITVKELKKKLNIK